MNSKVQLRDPAADFCALFAGLKGEWRLERDVSDGSRFSGTASFVPAGNGCLLLEEAGDLARKDKLFPASRRWLWRLREDEYMMDVLFDEPVERVYHELMFSMKDTIWRAEARHLCGKDVYWGEYSLSHDVLHTRQKITGPNKDLTLESRFLRSC